MNQQHLSLNNDSSADSENYSTSSNEINKCNELISNNSNHNNNNNGSKNNQIIKDKNNNNNNNFDLNNNIQYSIPVGYRGYFHCKTLQGSIFLLIRQNNNINLPKYLALKQAFKKCVHENISLNKIYIKENFLEEYTKLSQLQFLSCVIKIHHQLFYDEHSYYFSIEFAKYGDLLQYVNNVNKQIPNFQQNLSINNDVPLCQNSLQNVFYNNIPKIFYQICKNVYKLHLLHCAHLDISLENIVLTNSPTSQSLYNLEHLKFIDFGVAQIFDINNNNMKKYFLYDKKTNKIIIFYNQFVGKINYMAPEVCRCHLNEKNSTNSSSKNYIYNPFKADIWSLGVILYLLYCNKHPFSKESIISCNDNYNLLISKLEYSNHVPISAIDLLSKIFINEAKRLNIQQVLEHKYFK